MADDARQLSRLVEQFRQMPADDQRRVLDHLAPSERVALQRKIEPERNPETLLSRALAERIEMLRDGSVVGVTAMGRDAMVRLAAEQEDVAVPTPAAARRVRGPSLADKIARSLVGLVS
jgi:hypothetical protein